jgi:peptidyl-prolyl cis-trans isomerase D
MAIIGTIRKHSAIAVILVGVAIGAFILSDLFNKPGRRKIHPIGIINGTDITVNEYNQKVEDNIEIQRQNQGKQALDANDAFNVRVSTWNQYLNDIIMGKQYDELDLAVTTDELFDQVQGPNPHRLIMQYFTDPKTGKYSPDFVANFLQNLDKLDPSVKKQWISLEKYIKQDRLNAKYQSLVSKGYYVPAAFARLDYLAKSRAARFRYTAIRYSSLSDSLLTLTNEDYQKYYDENKQLYEQDASRDIDYVIFDVQPSADDRAKIRDNTFQIYDEFLTVADVPSFVNATSDNRYDSTWYKKGKLPVTIDSLLFNAPIGTCVPPYEENGTWHMAKLMDIASRPDSMKAEHILISFHGAYKAPESLARTKEDANKLADSLLNVVKGNDTRFKALAIQYSDDASAKDKQGDLGWFADGSMVYPFNEAVVKGKVGDLLKVESPFGFHVIRITGKQEPVKKIRVALIDRLIEPSSKTFQDVYAEASTFAGENNTREKFDRTVTEKGLNKRTATYLKDMANSIPGITNPREVIRWAFYDGIKLGEVSPVFDVGGAYTVALVTQIREKGPIPIEQIKENLKTFVMNDKKADYIIEKVKAAPGDVYQIAGKFGSKVDTNTTLTFASRNIPGFGSEFTVIGSIFAMKAGQESEPIQGNGAVFVMQLDGFTEPPEVSDVTNYKNQLRTAFQGRVTSNYVFTALQNKAAIEDNRRLYF